MDNQDKIINKIKEAAHNAEHQDFPGMDKVWSRIEDKLDQKALETKSKVWKKMAIAASVLLLVSLGYQVTKPSQVVIEKEKTIVVVDSVVKPIPKPIEEAVVSAAIDTVAVAKAIRKMQTVVATKDGKNEVVALQEVQATPDEKERELKKADSERQKAKSTQFNRGKIYDAVEVTSAYGNAAASESVMESVAKPVSAAAPLVVMNGKLMSGSNYKTVKEAKREIISNLDDEEVDSLIVLKEPLYIINGVEYSELSLFGTNPTSPYAPLNKQKIVTLEILQNEEATDKYGDKGKKGVVIITTENGKPLKK
ncbi:hypothetical protein [Flavobacterium sp.]|uniref:hypothetical protein n=1 Tax=Flavobacterium sp. TaxID=239 RepID=UPI003C4C3904